MLDLSIIVINYNTKKMTLECIESVRKFTKNIEYEIILIENSTDQNEVLNLNSKDIKSIRNEINVGFGKANNQGVEVAQGKYVLFLNSDTLLVENSLFEMVKWMKDHPKAGAITCKLLYKNRKVQTAGGNFPTLFKVFMWATFLDDIPGISRIFGSYHLSADVPISKDMYKYEHQQDWISGAVFLSTTEILKKVGGFDDDIFMYGEDVELSYRIKKAGHQIWYVPATKIIHFGSASSSGESVNFLGTTFGKRNAILNEFKGLKAFYIKHYPKFYLSILKLILMKAAILRIIVFGIIGRQSEAIKIYGEALRQA